MSFGSKKDIVDIEDILEDETNTAKKDVAEQGADNKKDSKQEKRERREKRSKVRIEKVGEVKDYYDEDEIDRNDPVCMGEWVWSILLASIPIVNIVCLCVWAFGKNAKPSKKYWSRAKLIWVLVATVIFALISAFCIGLLAAIG